MCYHNSLSKNIRSIAARYKCKTNLINMANHIIQEAYHINAFNYPLYPIITKDIELQFFYWGLIPHWVESETEAQEIRNMTMNARAESVFYKRSFRDSILTRRCLIPCTGFFEWQHKGKQKTPYYIFLKDEEIFSMAGIYDIWTDEQTQSTIVTFSQITTEANELMSSIHNSKKRMPAILPRDMEERWLDPKLTQKEIKELLKPYPSEKMDAYTIENNFLKKNPHDSSIIEKASGSLF